MTLTYICIKSYGSSICRMNEIIATYLHVCTVFVLDNPRVVSLSHLLVPSGLSISRVIARPTHPSYNNFNDRLSDGQEYNASNKLHQAKWQSR